MAKKGAVEISGLEAVYSLLDGLPLQMKANALNSAHRKAMNEFIIKPAKTTKPEFADAWKVGNDRDDKLAVLGGARGYNKINKEGNINALVLWEEYGVEQRKTKKGYNRGRFAIKRPFFRALVKRQYGPITKYLNTKYGDLVGRFIERKLKRTKKFTKYTL